MNEGQRQWLCIGCGQWYARGDISHTLRSLNCVCVGCQADDEDENETSGDTTDFQRRYEQ